MGEGKGVNGTPEFHQGWESGPSIWEECDEATWQKKWDPRLLEINGWAQALQSSVARPRRSKENSGRLDGPQRSCDLGQSDAQRPRCWHLEQEQVGLRGVGQVQAQWPSLPHLKQGPSGSFWEFIRDPDPRVCAYISGCIHHNYGRP